MGYDFPILWNECTPGITSHLDWMLSSLNSSKREYQENLAQVLQRYTQTKLHTKADCLGHLELDAVYTHSTLTLIDRHGKYYSKYVEWRPPARALKWEQ